MYTFAVWPTVVKVCNNLFFYYSGGWNNKGEHYIFSYQQFMRKLSLFVSGTSIFGLLISTWICAPLIYTHFLRIIKFWVAHWVFVFCISTLLLNIHFFVFFLMIFNQTFNSLQKMEPTPTAPLDRNNDRVYDSTTSVVRAVMALSQGVQGHQANLYLDLVKKVP